MRYFEKNRKIFFTIGFILMMAMDVLILATAQ